MNKIQLNVVTALKRMIAMTEADEGDAKVFASELDQMLDGLQGADFFGTEGQNDPRGDWRDGQWFLLPMSWAAPDSKKEST